jgi:phasin family protein
MASNYTNPLLAYTNMDFTKFDPGSLLKNASLPGLDVDALLQAQRKNLEALTKANALVVEGVQAVAKRQSEIMTQSMAEMQKAVSELGTSSDPRELATRQADMVKQAFERAIANMREVAETVQKSNLAAVDAIGQRVSSGLDELKSMKTWT